jgi:AAA+ ATPase superfamily predicted ATPase
MGLLESAFAARGSAFIPIYGRRRVGKSELVLRFLKNKTGIYYLGKKAPAGLQVRELLQEAAAALREPLLAALSAADWKTALRLITDRWAGPHKLVLALDEFQWMVEVSPELPSVLQEFWDRHWSRSGSVLLILCGSYVGFMEREILGRQSPLFGRRTAQILLRPFGYREAAEFHPSYSLVDRAQTYFVCGGIPLYLRYFFASRSVEMNIAQNLLSEFAPLFREPDFLLRDELREMENYYAILLALASGCSTNRLISEQTGIEERSLHHYLQQLVELGYAARRYPLTGRPPVRRHVRYGLEDPLLRFWFRFVYPNTSFVLQAGPQRALADRIRPGLDAYFGSCFERLCREALPSLYAREGVTAAFEVGEYWDKTTQIDVVGRRDDGWTDLGECRWGAVRTARPVLAELEEKVRRYPNPSNATIGRRIFTRRPVTAASDAPPGNRCHSLEELYSPV